MTCVSVRRRWTRRGRTIISNASHSTRPIRRTPAIAAIASIASASPSAPWPGPATPPYPRVSQGRGGTLSGTDSPRLRPRGAVLTSIVRVAACPSGARCDMAAVVGPLDGITACPWHGSLAPGGRHHLALRRPAPPVALTTRRWLFAAALAPLLGLRLYHLHRYVLRGDEGVYLESLLLMARGYLPFRDFFCSQGPLFLPLLYPFTLLGSGVFWPRLGVVLYTLVGLLAAAALGRRLGGPVAGVASLVVLGLSPNLLFVSRLTLAEGPALGLATAAVWLATRAPARPWLAGSAAMLAAALLVKPMLAPAGLAVLALALAPRLRARAWGALAVDLALMAAVALLVLAVVVAPFGIANVLDQLVAFHTEVTRVEQRGRLVGGWDNLASALPKLADEGPGLYALGTVGLLLALRARQALGLGVILWLLGTAALLWIYVPFYDRYLAFLLPPLALLAGL